MDSWYFQRLYCLFLCYPPLNLSWQCLNLIWLMELEQALCIRVPGITCAQCVCCALHLYLSMLFIYICIYLYLSYIFVSLFLGADLFIFSNFCLFILIFYLYLFIYLSINQYVPLPPYFLQIRVNFNNFFCLQCSEVNGRSRIHNGVPSN